MLRRFTEVSGVLVAAEPWLATGNSVTAAASADGQRHRMLLRSMGTTTPAKTRSTVTRLASILAEHDVLERAEADWLVSAGPAWNHSPNL